MHKKNKLKLVLANCLKKKETLSERYSLNKLEVKYFVIMPFHDISKKYFLMLIQRDSCSI